LIRRGDRVRLSRSDDPSTLATEIGDARYADIKNPMPVGVLREFAAALADCNRLRICIYEAALDRQLEVVNAFRELATARVWLLASASTRLDFDALAGHPAVERIRFTSGGRRDLRWLPSLPNLLDLELWRITRLGDEDLAPLGDASLDALVLGAARHVRSLAFAPATLRYLELERTPHLDSFDSLETRRLRAVVLTEARPSDRRLTPLARSPLDAALVGDVYPPDEVAAFANAFSGRLLSVGGEYLVGTHDVAPELGWRTLLDHVDAERRRDG
jgi:hypothetical protein